MSRTQHAVTQKGDYTSFGKSKTLARERIDLGYTGTRAEMEVKLPEYPPEALIEAREPFWMNWMECPPTQPGWYWVCGQGLWPQVIEYIYKYGYITPADRHSSIDSECWLLCAGPIPDPAAPLEIHKRNQWQPTKRGQRHAQ